MLYDLPEDEYDALLVREDAAGKGWRDLKIYRLGHDLGVAAHHLSLRLPKYELYETGSQLRRAAKSVSANIVEGFGRRCYKAEFLRFLIYAKASLYETEEHLQYIRDCHAQMEEAADLLEKAGELGRRLNRFIASVEEGHRT